MSLDKYSTVYFLTMDGWVERPAFKGKDSDIIEEWDVSVIQPSIRSTNVTWTQAGTTSPKLKQIADKLRAKFPRPADSTF